MARFVHFQRWRCVVISGVFLSLTSCVEDVWVSQCIINEDASVIEGADWKKYISVPSKVTNKDISVVPNNVRLIIDYYDGSAFDAYFFDKENKIRYENGSNALYVSRLSSKNIRQDFDSNWIDIPKSMSSGGLYFYVRTHEYQDWSWTSTDLNIRLCFGGYKKGLPTVIRELFTG